jgi:hypothetical protein
MNRDNEDSFYSFKQTHVGRSNFPAGEWGESSEFSHEDEALSETNRSLFADTLLSVDEKIHADVVRALTANPIVEACGIHVSVIGGVVTLTGIVQSKSLRQEAESCVENVTGVEEVKNDIKLGGNL